MNVHVNFQQSSMPVQIFQRDSIAIDSVSSLVLMIFRAEQAQMFDERLWIVQSVLTASERAVIDQAVELSHVEVFDERSGECDYFALRLTECGRQSCGFAAFQPVTFSGTLTKVSLFLTQLLQRLTVSAEWHSYFSSGIRASKNGTMICGNIMRRRAFHGLEYRAMTESEIVDAGWDQALQI
ncbi:MAG: hypothetical protein JWM58_2870 [Rhizobium sp.]|nr:hypothetical protein [Rhizobium sp.]